MSDTSKPIPPARVAGRAGDTSYVPDWDPGKQALRDAPPQVVPVQQRSIDVAAPVVVEGITIKPAKLMEPAEARNMMARIIGDMLVWIDGYPYELAGEEAYVLRFFQDLQARRQARVQAKLHDQAILPDAIDQARFKP
jgi:hypothetical protein